MPDQKPCKTCGTTDPDAFYSSQQSTRYCKIHHRQRYFAPGRERLLQAKLARGACADCGLVVTPETLALFDFDHVAEGKRYNVSKMTTCSTATFNAEIARCELVCSNDHRRRTVRRRRETQPTPPSPPQSASGSPNTIPPMSQTNP